MMRKLLCCFCILGLPFSAYAQSDTFYQYRYLGEQLISSFAEDAPHSFWVSTYDGIFRYDLALDSLYTFRPYDGQRGHAFTDLLFDREGNLWASGRSVLVKFDGSDWYSLPIKKDSDYLVGLARDSRNNIWVSGGLGNWSPFVLRIAGDRSTYFDSDDGLIQDRITALLVDHLDQVWTTTEWGINVYADERWQTIDSVQGESLFKLNGLCEDGTGNVWITSELNEIFKADPDKLILEVIKPPSPLGELRHVACRGDEVWVASQREIAHYEDGIWMRHPELTQSPDVVIVYFGFSQRGDVVLGTSKGLTIMERKQEDASSLR
ncbi:MAG TPA: hypothetical protein VFG50_02285 [Rhodothermales bacterium]|nr:hypothetical protein [Rhodothermales bacterium]